MAPGAPKNLTATAGPGGGQISLAWQAPDGILGVSGYKVYRGTSSGGESFLSDVGNVLSFVDSGLPNGATYYYRVSAYNLFGEGPQSNEASATTFDVPSAPLNLMAVAGPGAGEISLAWNAPAHDGGAPVANYTVYAGSASGGETLLATIGNVLAYRETGLGNGVTRYYKVSASNAAGEGPKSNEASATTFSLPSAPQGLVATAGSGVGEITLAWSAPASNGGTPVTGYRVYRGATSGSETLLATLGNVLAFTDSGLGNGVTRYYKVSAVNLVGEGPQSGEASATTFVPPGPPQNVVATAGPGVGEITLNWQAPASDGGMPVTSYDVYRASSSGGETLLVQLGVTLTYKDAGLSSATTYYYKVSAANAVGEGAQSAEASTSTFSPPGAPTSPAAATGSSGGQIVLTWSAPASDGGAAVTGYRIYRGSASGGETFLAQIGSVLTFTDAGLPAATTFYYRVSAVNAVGEGAQSAEASATTLDVPSAPQGLTAAPGSSVGAIDLHWSAPASSGQTPVSGYRIYRATGDGSFAFLVQVDASSTSYTDTGLTLLQKYRYEVTAVNSLGEGLPSNVACATPFPWVAGTGILPDCVQIRP